MHTQDLSKHSKLLNRDALDFMVKQSTLDDGEMDKYLTPFLVERVSGTKGNSVVQKVGDVEGTRGEVKKGEERLTYMYKVYVR